MMTMVSSVVIPLQSARCAHPAHDEETAAALASDYARGLNWRGSLFFHCAGAMAEYAVLPGARVVWRLRRRSTDVRCVVLPASMPVEVHVVHGDDVVLTELFQEEWMAMNWARAYRDRLRAQGWGDVQGPADP
jgi:hypothetical protein